MILSNSTISKLSVSFEFTTEIKSLMMCHCLSAVPATRTFKMCKVVLLPLLLTIMISVIMVHCGHYIIPGAMPYDGYHDLHLPHDPPLYPTLSAVPQTRFTCLGKEYGYYADVDAACQAYHLCGAPNHKASFLCTNGTLFNEQFQVCDQFYNVRCGSPYIDL